MRASRFRPRPARAPRDAATRRRAPHRTFALLCLGAGVACAGARAGDPAPTPESAPLAAGSLRVSLAFGPEADLDLYVTGPSQETVYFGNALSRDGGRLAADLRCDAPAPRTERVVFADPPAGLYRVGVDFMTRCRGGVDRAPYTLVVEAPGREPLRLEGVADFGVFVSRVGEVRVGR